MEKIKIEVMNICLKMNGDGFNQREINYVYR